MGRRQSFSSLGATSFQHEASVLAGHARPEAVCLCASSVVRLKSALRHRNEFSLKTKTLRLIAACVYVKKPHDLLGVLCDLRGSPARNYNSKTENEEIRREPQRVFNIVVYQKDALAIQNSDQRMGDQRVLFYSFTSLDHSESSMLVSAGFEGHHPLTN